MNERRHVDALRHTLEPPSASAATSSCLSDDTLAAFSEGSLAHDRETILLHLAECARCRGMVASVARVLANPEVSRELDRRSTPGKRKISFFAIPAAVAAAVLVLLMRSPSNDSPLVHRAPTIAASDVPILVPPSGEAGTSTVLRWHRVSGADRYRVALFDEGGRTLFELQLTDTITVVPDTVRLNAGSTYLWKVGARMGFDRWTSSEFMKFTAAPGR